MQALTNYDNVWKDLLQMRLQWSRGYFTQPNVYSRCSLHHNFDSFWHSKGQEEVTTALCLKANSQFKETKEKELLMELILFLCHTGLLKLPIITKTLTLHFPTNHPVLILNRYTQKWITEHTALFSCLTYQMCPSGRVYYIRRTSRATVEVSCRRLTLLWDVTAAKFCVAHVSTWNIHVWTAGDFWR